jgi:hypothetical protein
VDPPPVPAFARVPSTGAQVRCQARVAGPLVLWSYVPLGCYSLPVGRPDGRHSHIVLGAQWPVCRCYPAPHPPNMRTFVVRDAIAHG